MEQTPTFNTKYTKIKINKDFIQEPRYFGYIAIEFDFKNEQNSQSLFFAAAMETRMMAHFKEDYKDFQPSNEDWSILLTPISERLFEEAPNIVGYVLALEKEYDKMIEGTI